MRTIEDRTSTKDNDLREMPKWETLRNLSATTRERNRPPTEQSLDMIEKLCQQEQLSIDELSELLGVGVDRTRTLVQELLKAGRIQYTIPDKPTSHHQRYTAEGKDPNQTALQF